MRYVFGRQFSEAEYDGLCEKWDQDDAQPAESPNREQLWTIYRQALDLDDRKLADEIGYEMFVNHANSDVEPWLVNYFADQLAARKAATC